MAGTWESMNKVLPGAYINIRTNKPLSITPGDRGTVLILQEMSAGADNMIYTITAAENEWPDGATAADKLPAAEALKKAKTVLIYKLPPDHDADALDTALAAVKTLAFNTLCYPYNTGKEAEKTKIVTWIKAMREDEGIKCQAVLADCSADSEGIINVVQGIVMADGTILEPAQLTAWAAGAAAGAGITASNTGMKYMGAVDVVPRMTKTEMEAAVRAGQLIFKVDSAQNVTVVYDINSLLTFTADKGEMFRKNRVIRTLDNIGNDITAIFESNYIGKVNNDDSGRSLLRASLVEYFNQLQAMGAIRDFETADITIRAGNAADTVAVDTCVQPVDSVEKIYMTVNLS